jgi:hypothetical protein
MISTVIALGACSVSELENMSAAPKIVNTCEVDADCKTANTHRGTCGSGMCIASSGDIDTAFLEVIPPASAYWGAGDSFLVALDSLSHGDWARDISLPKHASITGRLTTSTGLLGEPPSESCAQIFDPSTQSLRVHLELSRSDAALGLPALTVSANAEKAKNGGWEFKTSVPAGTYDVYATALSGCDADFPPLFAPGQSLESGDVTFELHVGALSTLTGLVTPPTKNTDQHVSLAGWQVSLVEPERGRVISTTRKLNDSNPTNFGIRYQPLTNAAPLLQLTPPKDTVAPVVFWDLSVLDLDGDGQVEPSLATLDLSTVQVSGSVVDDGVNPVAGASVRIRSTQLLGAAQGLSARYETTTTSDGEGAISLPLLPGTYQVVATPPDREGLAIARTTWTIGRSPAHQAGRTVELPALPLLQGSVLDPVGSRPIEGIPVNVIPSTFGTSRFFDRILDTAPLVPRATSGFTDDLGRFSVGVDPGIVDMSAQPRESSKFPWLVRARVEVPADPLGPMFVSFPVPVAGTLRDPSGNPVQQALLKVFALVDSSSPSTPRGSPTVGVLQVGEGRTDKLGHFTLLLPAQLQD